MTNPTAVAYDFNAARAAIVNHIGYYPGWLNYSW